jgi:hypothetical protein
VGRYDRLVDALVFLELQHMGLLIPAIKSIKSSWVNATHTIKTKYGYSSMKYKNIEAVPLFGPGQGSNTGPTLWGIIFNIIAKNMPEDYLVIMFKAVDNSDTVTHKGDAFVDGSQLGCTARYKGFSESTAQDIHRQQRITVVRDLQKVSQWWEKLLFTTGGALNLQKIFWILMSWKWQKG